MSKHMSINSPTNDLFQANDHQLLFDIAKFKKVDYRRCDGCLYEEFGMLSNKWCGEFRIYNDANTL